VGAGYCLSDKWSLPTLSNVEFKLLHLTLGHGLHALLKQPFADVGWIKPHTAANSERRDCALLGPPKNSEAGYAQQLRKFIGGQSVLYALNARCQRFKLIRAIHYCPLFAAPASAHSAVPSNGIPQQAAIDPVQPFLHGLMPVWAK